MTNIPALYNDDLARTGQRANEAARLTVFGDYYSRKSAGHIRSLRNTLKAWAGFLMDHNVSRAYDDLAQHPDAWRGVTAGLVKSFQATCKDEGYAIASINTMLSHVKIYVALAYESGLIPEDEFNAIHAIRSYARREAPNLDRKRSITRISAEKITHTAISLGQAEQLKHMHPRTSRGFRNAVLMALLLDHGLRADEVAKLTVKDMKLGKREFTMYRSKTHGSQTLAMSASLQRALSDYLTGDLAQARPLLMGNRKHVPDELSGNGMTRQRIFDEVRSLGRDADISGPLSPHDCRVHWALTHYRTHRDLARLQREGGWNSIIMPMHYMQEALRAEELEQRKQEAAR